MAFERKKYPDGFTTVEGTEYSKRKLAYAELFKLLIVKQPRMLKSFIKIMEDFDYFPDIGRVCTLDNISVELVKVIEVIGQETGEISRTFGDYKVSVRDDIFFVKRRPPLLTGGYREAVAVREAEKLLQSIPGVAVVPLVMGYTSSTDSFFVSEWRDAFHTTLTFYLIDLDKRIARIRLVLKKKVV